MTQHSFEKLTELEDDMVHQLMRKRQAEASDSPALVELFEVRLNRSLDEWTELAGFAGHAALLNPPT